jgi:putative zinc finger protein
MTETFTCGNHGELMSYLYDECSLDERRWISAHVAICRACAEELTALGATREQLTTWTPPDAQLGFRIVSEAPRPNVLRPLNPRWWQKPMPAWAQVAAAGLIFATGVTLGALRGTDRGPEGSTPLRGASTLQQAKGAEVVGANAVSVTRADLVALEQRLRSEMSRVRAASAPAAAAPADARILQQVRAMIDDSEQRQRRELALRTTEVVRDFDAQRNDDLARIERTLGQMDGTTGVEVAQQRQMLNYLMRVSQRGQ